MTGAPPRRAIGLAVSLLGLGGSARAHAADTPDGPPAAVRIEKIERGVFADVAAGPTFLVAPDAAADYGGGFGLSMHFGVDLTPVLRLSAGADVVAAGGTLDREGVAVSADRLYLGPGVRLQLAVFTTERHFLWVGAQGGLGVLGAGSGEGSEASIGPSFGAQVGWEYFTVLRHFSLGARLGAVAFLEPDLGVAITAFPTLRYTF